MRRKPKIKEAVGAEATAGDETSDASISIPDSQRPSRKILTAYQIFSSVTSLQITSVVLYSRCSTNAQKHNGSIEDQFSKLRRYCTRHNIEVIAEVCDVGKGGRIKRKGLLKAFRLARQTGSVVLAETVSRFLRPNKYNPKDRTTWTIPNYARFHKYAKGVVCATLLKPTASPRREKSVQTKRGLKRKGTGGGDRKRGWSKRRMFRLKPLVCRLRFDEQRGYGEIVRIIGRESKRFGWRNVSRQTVKRWCSEV